MGKWLVLMLISLLDALVTFYFPCKRLIDFKMYIIEAKVKGLSGHIDCDFAFHRDINVITGVNGSGKTTFLKLLWYVVSGNVERILAEINFRNFALETSEYTVQLGSNGRVIKWVFSRNGREHDSGGLTTVEGEEGDSDQALNKLIVAASRSSVFFPTFRRIEGGYTMSDSRGARRRVRGMDVTSDMFGREDIQTEFDALSQRISVLEHRFVCSISTHDIVSLLTGRYAAVSADINEDYRKFSTEIISKIAGAKSELQAGNERAAQILSSLQDNADAINKKRDKLMRPFTVLSSLAAQIFRHKGIKVNTVMLGQAADAIDSSVLSAGEKQMLSFLSYNAFYANSPIFIDEPELSLHPDWQRRLFPTLLGQQGDNQFIVATHSPFIYSKYQDKELCMSRERGE